MDDNKVYKILKNFSFSEQEISVYLAVLKLGKASVTEIASKTGIGRTGAYFHIKNLTDRGYLKKLKTKGRDHYSAESPEELLNELQKELSSFKLLVPELEAMSRIDKEVPSIDVKESLPALFKIYDDISHLPINAEFRVLEGRKAMMHEINMLKNEKLIEFFDAIKERKIVTRAIFTQEGLGEAKKRFTKTESEEIQKRDWLLTTLPENLLPFDELIYLYGNKVVFMFPDSSTVVFIKHRRIYQAMKAIFDSLHYFAQSQPHPWD